MAARKVTAYLAAGQPLSGSANDDFLTIWRQSGR
jgi:hypothetical protein